MARGKVITTHLRTGDPNGIRTVFISNKICEMIVFPKSEFEMVSKMEESSRPALYILLGEDENGSAQAYVRMGDDILEIPSFPNIHPLVSLFCC